MGCDIHLHTEIKVANKWHHYSHPRLERDYRFFCKVAGVRGPIEDIEPVSEPRGFPKNASFTTKLDESYGHADYHSHSWLSGDELADVLKWYEEIRKGTMIAAGKENPWFSSEHHYFGYLFGNGWRLHPDERGSAYPRKVQAVRAVFWFDN